MNVCGKLNPVIINALSLPFRILLNLFYLLLFIKNGSRLDLATTHRLVKQSSISLGLCSVPHPPTEKLINSVQNEIIGQFGAIHVKCHLNVITCVTQNEENHAEDRMCYAMDKEIGFGWKNTFPSCQN